MSVRQLAVTAYNLWEAPDNTSMAAGALAIAGGGALNSFEMAFTLR